MENSRNFSQRKTDGFHDILPWSTDEIRDVFPRVIDAIRDDFFFRYFRLNIFRDFSRRSADEFLDILTQLTGEFRGILSQPTGELWNLFQGQWTTFELLVRDRLTNIFIFSLTYWRISRYFSATDWRVFCYSYDILTIFTMVFLVSNWLISYFPVKG